MSLTQLFDGLGGGCGVKFGMTCPTGSTRRRLSVSVIGDGANGPACGSFTKTTASPSNGSIGDNAAQFTSGSCMCVVEYEIQNGSTAGTCQLQIAQVVATGTLTVGTPAGMVAHKTN